MFGWFKPTCPCDPSAKQWIEDRLQWLTRQFGLHILLERSIILPTDEFFPDDYDGSRKSLGKMFRRVCRYMDVDPDDVEMKLFKDKSMGGPSSLGAIWGSAAGTWEGGEEPWQKGIIRIEQSAIDQPSDLVGTMAHELAHQRLLGEGRADADAFDNELLTDLTALFFGLGVFIANYRKKPTGDLSGTRDLTHWPGTNLRKPEYMSAPMIGYALAHIAWFRDEKRPAWAEHLHRSPQATLKQGLQYLRETMDSSFKPVRLR